jgi:hypothetical protein
MEKRGFCPVRKTEAECTGDCAWYVQNSCGIPYAVKMLKENLQPPGQSAWQTCPITREPCKTNCYWFDGQCCVREVSCLLGQMGK